MLLLFNTTRMVPGPPSTGVAIAMDGGMADSFVAFHCAHPVLKDLNGRLRCPRSTQVPSTRSLGLYSMVAIC